LKQSTIFADHITVLHDESLAEIYVLDDAHNVCFSCPIPIQGGAREETP
jgi:hypothetical protein